MVRSHDHPRSIHCSLLKLRFKTFSELLRYINFGAVAACRVLCVSRALFRMSLVMVVRRMLCSVVCVIELQHARCNDENIWYV